MSLFKRLSEPSTGAALASLVALFMPQAAPFVPDLVTSVGTVAAAGAGLYGILKSEAGNAK